MTDPASLARLRLIYPDIATRWFRVADDLARIHRKQLKITESMRTFSRQGELYAQGRTTTGIIVTHALPGQSFHNYGLALDSAFFGDDPYLEKEREGAFFWNEYGRFCAAHGLVWGGLWAGRKSDRPHAELSYGLSERDCRKLYDHNGLIAVWAECDRRRGVAVGQEWKSPSLGVKILEPGKQP